MYKSINAMRDYILSTISKTRNINQTSSTQPLQPVAPSFVHPDGQLPHVTPPFVTMHLRAELQPPLFFKHALAARAPNHQPKSQHAWTKKTLCTSLAKYKLAYFSSCKLKAPARSTGSRPSPACDSSSAHARFYQGPVQASRCGSTWCPSTRGPRCRA